MTTINLYQNQEEVQKKVSDRTANGGFFFSLGILALTIMSVFGIKFYVASVVEQNLALVAEVQAKSDSLVGINSLQRILDMQTRIIEINKNLEVKEGKVEQLGMTEVLDNVEKSMSSGVVITKYAYNSEGKSVNVSFQSGNFNDTARQILNFKKSSYFSNVALANVSRAENGVSAEMSMRISD